VTGDAEELRPLRRDYAASALTEDVVDGGRPMAEVRTWLDTALAADVPEPTAATLATVDADGVPDARIVLLRAVDDDGVVWYSNRRSAKGRQLAAHPVAAVVLFWPALERQVRLRGRVEHVPDEVSDRYWAGRPRASQLAARASEQSASVPDRAALEARVAAVAAHHPDGTPVPRPPHWGGERLRPDAVELWQGRPGRLHDRLRWTRDHGGWRLERLMP
jgi:pyridoxamine 5'-phosphate oxidase